MKKDVEEKVQEFEEEWVKKVDGLLAERKIDRLPKPPEGSFTAEQYAKKSEMNISTARHRLHDLVKAGKLKRVRLGNKNYYFFP